MATPKQSMGHLMKSFEINNLGISFSTDRKENRHCKACLHGVWGTWLPPQRTAIHRRSARTRDHTAIVCAVASIVPRGWGIDRPAVIGWNTRQMGSPETSKDAQCGRVLSLNAAGVRTIGSKVGAANDDTLRC